MGKIKKFFRFAAGLLLVVVLVLGVIFLGIQGLNLAGTTLGHWFDGPWKGIVTADSMADNAEAGFKTLEECRAWGQEEVKAHGGSYECGENCELDTTVGASHTYKCEAISQ